MQIMSKRISYRVKSVSIGSIQSSSNQQVKKTFTQIHLFLLHSI